MKPILPGTSICKIFYCKTWSTVGVPFRGGKTSDFLILINVTLISNKVTGFFVFFCFVFLEFLYILKKEMTIFGIDIDILGNLEARRWLYYIINNFFKSFPWSGALAVDHVISSHDQH